MVRFERRYIPMMLLVMGVGLFAGVMIMAGHSPAVGRVVPVLSEAPPGGVIEATPVPVPLPVEGEMTVIEPVQTAEPQITQATLREYEKAIYLEVNRRRVENGLPALLWDDRIADVARKHSEDMVARGYFSHTDLQGRNSHDRFRTTTAAENIKGSWWDVTKDVDDWMASPGHRSNILHPMMRQTGVGVALGPEWPLITQNFLP